MAAVGGTGLDDEGMPSVLALFLDVIYKNGIQTTTKNQVERKITAA